MGTKQSTKKILSLLLALAMIVTSIMVMPVNAKAAQASYELSMSEYDIAVGATATLTLYKNDKKVKSFKNLTFSSSKSAVASVNSKGVVTGKKAGTTTIKVTENVKGKKKTLCSVECTVNKVRLAVNKVIDVPVSTSFVNKYPVDFSGFLSYKNPKATYKFTAADAKKVKISSKGKLTSVNGKKGEKVKVTVKETYNKKTQNVASFTLRFIEPSLTKKSAEYSVGDYFMPMYNLSNMAVDGELGYASAASFYRYGIAVSKEELSEKEAEKQCAELEQKAKDEMEDADFAYSWDYNTGVLLETKQEGTYNVYYCLYDYKSKKYEYLDKLVLTVKTYTSLSSVTLDEWDTTQYVGETSSPDIVLYANDANGEEIRVNEKAFLGAYEVTSSNPAVVDAVWNEEEKKIECKFVSAGEATVTVTAGGQTASVTYNVVNDSDDDYEEEEDW